MQSTWRDFPSGIPGVAPEQEPLAGWRANPVRPNTVVFGERWRGVIIVIPSVLRGEPPANIGRPSALCNAVV